MICLSHLRLSGTLQPHQYQLNSSYHLPIVSCSLDTTGNQIIHPTHLKKYMTENNKIIVMNKLYLEEIKQELLKLEINANVIFIGDL